MTNEQLYLSIGVPVVVNAVFNGVIIGLLVMHMNTRFEDLKAMWRAELRRVEEVLDARLKHLEER